MDFPPADEAQFITQNLVPTLDQDGLHPRIYGLDGTELSYAEALEQSSAASDLAGIAWHCYGGQQVIGQFHQLYPKVTNLTSECSRDHPLRRIRGCPQRPEQLLVADPAVEPGPGSSGRPGGAAQFRLPRCTGLVTVNPQTRKAMLRLNYYELGQFSKFIKPGPYAWEPRAS